MSDIPTGVGAGDPVISVDTKKKELVGLYKNGGREWEPKGSPAQVKSHDFLDRHGPGVDPAWTRRGPGKAIPYGIYDVAADTGCVSVGTDHGCTVRPSTARFRTPADITAFSRTATPLLKDLGNAARTCDSL